MNYVANSPPLVLVVSFVVLWLSTILGDSLRKRRPPFGEAERQDFGLILAAISTLLGLIIGFTFSIAVSRYDQRRKSEAEEANAIGTEYVRTDLLPPVDAEKVRELLKNYLDQRILFYQAKNEDELKRINVHTAQLQRDLWSATQAAAAIKPTPLAALTVSGMNDVLNTEGYTQAAWWNRIPREAWLLLAIIAMGWTLLLGYGGHRTYRVLFLVLPLAVSISFFFIADIESPRRGRIYIVPNNLVRLSQSLHAH